MKFDNITHYPEGAIEGIGVGE